MLYFFATFLGLLVMSAGIWAAKLAGRKTVNSSSCASNFRAGKEREYCQVCSEKEKQSCKR